MLEATLDSHIMEGIARCAVSAHVPHADGGTSEWGNNLAALALSVLPGISTGEAILHGKVALSACLPAAASL